MDNGNTIATYAYSCVFGKDDVDRMYADARATKYGEVLDASGKLDDNLIHALLEIRLIDRDIKQTRNIEFVKSDNPNFVSHVNRLLQELFTGELTAYYAGARGKIIAIVK